MLWWNLTFLKSANFFVVFFAWKHKKNIHVYFIHTANFLFIEFCLILWYNVKCDETKLKMCIKCITYFLGFFDFKNSKTISNSQNWINKTIQTKTLYLRKKFEKICTCSQYFANARLRHYNYRKLITYNITLHCYTFKLKWWAIPIKKFITGLFS